MKGNSDLALGQGLEGDPCVEGTDREERGMLMQRWEHSPGLETGVCEE